MPLSTHPTPLLERDHWRSLDGLWRFCFDDEARWQHPREVVFDREIRVPYAPESLSSGVHDQGFHSTVWYSLTVTLTPEERSERLLLHFGAVDYLATVWVNGRLVAQHEGGSTPFTADITQQAQAGETVELVVRAQDNPHDLAKPRGKQDWQREPHSIWYPRTTGIWQTVWLERVPQTYLRKLRWLGDMEHWQIGLEAEVVGPLPPDLGLRVRLWCNGDLLADDRYAVRTTEIARRIALADPGIDDFRNELLWSPGHPQLIDAELELLVGDRVIDRVRSYTALRSVSVNGNRFLLNGRPYYLRLVLDQGYWPDSLMTATDEELRRDVELAKRLGFNGVRKHQKIESPRWLYWCDVLGLLVWEEMPSAYRFTPAAVGRLTREWLEVLERDISHPCIVTWVPLNESWGVPDLPTNPAHRDYVRALYFLTKTLDPSRPVVGNDGWEHVATDIVTIHDYADDIELLRRRYGTLEATRLTLQQQQPADRALTLAGFEVAGQPVVLSEFGGIAYIPGQELGWGYSESQSEEDFVKDYGALLSAIHECHGLSGFCYTQLTDTFQEKNGLLYADRTPKADIQKLARSTQGTRTAREMTVDPILNPFGNSARWLRRQQETLMFIEMNLDVDRE
ncbi:glycoside hydrolase family 2, sugar binding protein (plasmid) [Deinococcus geothermalis DSM 11300]|uniref:Glycoside hydrolase family 2, sugar binding protein n=1 Tax=Deinococcus geothermalis (strain DSM 11300 / CIP 105573 / AG-3a) TaxID=319795 RepID=Q1J3L7_DEIGD|nr:glycoside hydrolase family 2 TIM barrel-domain containing protein [Deinococcus geothermalis]ABF43917.1 glycoside hydrolase family 2, sugar binding protein [Deinococcus geothermalis DSM 11300]